MTQRPQRSFPPLQPTCLVTRWRCYSRGEILDFLSACMMLLIQLYNMVNLRRHLYILVLVRTKLLSEIVGTAGEIKIILMTQLLRT